MKHLHYHLWSASIKRESGGLNGNIPDSPGQALSDIVMDKASTSLHTLTHEQTNMHTRILDAKAHL